jgi:hypothetical protein
MLLRASGWEGLYLLGSISDFYGLVVCLAESSAVMIESVGGLRKGVTGWAGIHLQSRLEHRELVIMVVSRAGHRTSGPSANVFAKTIAVQDDMLSCMSHRQWT